MKKFSTINSSKENETYSMNFSNNENDQKHSFNKNRKNSTSPNGGGYIRVVITALIFITVISLLLYFFVFRSTSNSKVYTDNQVSYRIKTTDENGNETTTTQIEDYYDPSKYNSLGDAVDESSVGDLALVLLNPTKDSQDTTRPYKNVILYITLSNETNRLVYLSGQYTTLGTGQKSETVTFSANINYETYLQYVIPIINYVKVENKTEDNITTYVQYYSYSSGTYAFSLQQTSDVSTWLVPLVVMIIFAILIYLFYSRMVKGSGSGSGNPMAGFVNNVARKQTGSKIRFSDVAGCDEAKAELVEMVDYFHSTDKYTRLGAKLPHGVLLVGPPGTGKTLLAKAVAGEASVPFYSISGSDFVEMYVGVGASRVRSLFKTAKSNAPCLIFIDEIDAVGRQRGAGLGGGNDEREQTLNELLVEMDGFEDNNGVIVMAATNRSDVLDPALTRPGRFDRTITVDLPDKAGRAAILKVHARNKKMAADVSFDNIASRTVGFSGADLANILNDAAILAVRSNRNAITTADIDEAIDRAISGPAKKSHLEPAERRQVAYHEAGHAVIGLFLPYSDKVQKITIIPRGRTGGHVLMTPEKDRFLMTKNQLLARITGYLGGRTSEEIFFGDVSTGASNDIEVATNIARSMVTEYGMSDLGPILYEKPGGSVFLGRDYSSTQANYSTQIAFEIDKAIRSIIDTCHEDARKLLEEHKDDVTLIAETLIANETITADQIEYLLKYRKLPEVDEHKMTDDNNQVVKNPHDVILYPGYQKFYRDIDHLLETNPSLIVISVALGSGSPITPEAFKEGAKKASKDPSRIALLFVDYANSMSITMTAESFAQHLETYAGVPVLLVKTDETSLQKLKQQFGEVKKESAERKGVIKEILPSDKKDDENDKGSSPSNNDNEKKE